MSWRGSTDFKDRLFGALVYSLPLIYVLPYSEGVLTQFPQLGFIYVLISPLLRLYFGLNSLLPFGGLIIFFALWLGVVRNERISHFIRFNTLQAILLDLLIILFGLIIRTLFANASLGLLVQLFSNFIFLGVLIVCLYSIIQSVLGKYAEIPTLSDAVYAQVR